MIPLRDSIPSRSFPFVTVMIIAANVAVFLYQGSLSEHGLERFVYRWGAVPAEFRGFGGSSRGVISALPTLVTSMFLHGGLFHILFNMLYLWIFGDNVEDRLGHGGYLFFYLACGVIAASTQVFFSPGSETPMIGASGAIGGVMGAYLISYPRARVLTLIPIFFFLRFYWIPALFYLGFWFALQLFEALAAGGRLGGAATGGVAVWAHVGGFAAGALLVLILPKRAGTGGSSFGSAEPWSASFSDRRSRYR